MNPNSSHFGHLGNDRRPVLMYYQVFFIHDGSECLMQEIINVH
jgi:hypothetical protein